MEPIYNRDGSLWVPTKEQMRGFESIRKSVFAKKEPRRSLFDEDVILALLAAFALIGLMLMDGHAQNVGEPTLFFGKP
jgi:hypothetical protein